MIPLRDNNPSGKRPLLTYLLIAINAVVFFYMLSLGRGELELFVQNYALIPALAVQGQNLQSVLTSLFLHGSLAHLLGNMLFLHIFGDNIEARLGRLRFLIFYLVCGLVGSLGQLLINPSSTIPNLGASGAIAGLMGAYLTLFPRAKIEVLVPTPLFYRRALVPAYLMLGYWFFIQLLSGLGSFGLRGVGGIAFFAHIGGFVSGLILIRLLGGGTETQT